MSQSHTSATPCTFTTSVDRHFSSDGLDERSERALRVHLPTCETCRRRYERRLLLERLTPSAPPREERLARALGLAPRRRPRTSSWAVGVGLATASVAAAALLVLRQARPPDAAGFSPRGAGPAVLAPLEVYRVRGDGPAERVTGQLRASDELAFTYRNPAGKRRLMVFGLQGARVSWYFPGWTEQADNPVAVPIEPTATPRELQAAVSQPLAPGTLTLHALFTDAPLTVREVEAALDAGALPGVDTVLTLEVVP